MLAPAAIAQPASPASIASVAKAAIAAAILPQSAGDDVTIRPLAPKPSLFIDPPVGRPGDRGAGGLHSSAGGAAAVAHAAHAADRRAADAGAE